jgi:NhaA family Na+:H+ antiporter
VTAGGSHLLKQPVSDEDWIRGPADAPLTLVEYADYECPDCYHSYPILEEVIEAFGPRLRFVFRHFPMVSKHPNAQAAALASEAAGRQGKFWEMHRRLMSAEGALAADQLEAYAKEVGLDLARWRADRQSPDLHRKITRLKRLGVRSGVNGTPTLFVNAARYEGEAEPVSAAELTAALEVALASQG